MTTVTVNPDILKWARKSAGLDLAAAAKHIGLTSTEEISSEEKLSEIEAGKRLLTRKQLTKLASVYRRPLITFYMKERPAKSDRGEDFRQTPASLSKRENALLDTLLRDVKARQEMVREIFEDEEILPEQISGIASINDGVDKVVQLIADRLKFDYTSTSLRKGSANDLFKALRNKTEDAGVFVLLVGDLGSHHTALSADVFRGFAIADKITPFIVINDQDSEAARSFTLLHELAHIVIGESGVSGTPEANAPRDSRSKIERFCNDVAGEFLLSKKILRERPETLNLKDKESAEALITDIASKWSVSEAMVAYRINRIGWISDALYKELVAGYAARWRKIKQKRRDERKAGDGGPDFYIVKQSKLGKLVDVVRYSLRDNILTDTKAGQILGLKPTSVEPFLKSYEKKYNGTQRGIS